MKLRNLFFCLLFCATAAAAQDIITKTDGSKVEAKVEEITDTSVRYRKASNPTGPLYSIPLTSVQTIVYENGSVDNFNMPTTTNHTDDNVKREAIPQDVLGASAMNDAQLLRMADTEAPINIKYRKKAKTLRIIAWTGGAALIIGGIVGYNLLAANGGQYQSGAIVAAIGCTAGVGWCLGFNLGARKLIREAQEIEMYSASIIENEIFRHKDKSLMAGVNVMGNQMTRTQSIGLSLKLNF